MRAGGERAWTRGAWSAREGECTARGLSCAPSLEITQVRGPEGRARWTLPGTEQVSVGSSARSCRAGIHEGGPPELDGGSLRAKGPPRSPDRPRSPRLGPGLLGHRLSAARCVRSWPGGVGPAAPWSRQQRQRGPRGQRAASRSQRKQEALGCSMTTFLILSTTTKISAILLEGAFCLNFLFSCELRFVRSLLARLVFPSCSRLEVGRVGRIIYGCSVH